MNVAVIGASASPESYSRKAVDILRKKGHQVFPVHPIITEIDGLRVYSSITQITEPIDTVTMYISRKHSSMIIPDIIGCAPRRIIFNPGSENPELEEHAFAKGIDVLHACTLVLLTTDQF